MKTSELTGPALDWAGAKCEGSGPEWHRVDSEGYLYDRLMEERYSPSTNWQQGGPIIERERITLGYLPELWEARLFDKGRLRRVEYGPTPLIAAMRAYVASKLGDEVDVPAELKQGAKT